MPHSLSSRLDADRKHGAPWVPAGGLGSNSFPATGVWPGEAVASPSVPTQKAQGCWLPGARPLSCCAPRGEGQKGPAGPRGDAAAPGGGGWGAAPGSLGPEAGELCGPFVLCDCRQSHGCRVGTAASPSRPLEPGAQVRKGRHLPGGRAHVWFPGGRQGGDWCGRRGRPG